MNMSLSFLSNPDLLSLNGPKTPSPFPKSKVLDVADKLLSRAEREFTVVKIKLPESFEANKYPSRHASEPSSARRTMTDFQLSPQKSSVFSDFTLQSRSRTSYQVPQNSPCASSKCKDEESYVRNNGEKKSAKPKVCPHQVNLKTVYQRDQTTTNICESTEKSPTVSQFSMFYEQQKFVERKSQSGKENNAATIIFESDAKVISSTNTMSKQDVETNTDSETNFKTLDPFKSTPNASIISMKTSKPDQEDQCEMISKKTLNVQKLPSVNIRPEFTIQSGPKINIVASNSNIYKPKRKNSEFFDVVYPPSSPVFNGSSVQPESSLRLKGNHVEYVCERHVFPSGRLIPGTHSDQFRETFKEDGLSFDEKKSILLDLIESLSEKIEKQTFKEKKSCCRLTCSLPLLASVVNKMQVDCVKCVDVVSRQIDRLVQLMKEELRSQKALSEDHCCQLDETVQYQIVELELMQDVNSKQRQSSGTIRLLRHKEAEIEKVPKKTVSFESIPAAVEHTTTKVTGKSTNAKLAPKKRASTQSVEVKAKSALKSRESRPYVRQSAVVGNSITHKVFKPNSLQCHIQKNNESVKNVNTTSKKLEKESTVIGQAIRNLSNRKSILKSDSASEKGSLDTSNQNKDNLNAFYKIVDQKEVSNDFDKWVRERSFKIQKIHEELSKMVAGSIENYTESQPVEWNSSVKNCDEETGTDLTNKYTEEDKTFDEDKHGFHENPAKHNEEHRQGPELPEGDFFMQEVSQEYVEDFEEDEEEASSNRNSTTEDYDQQTLAEAESGSSSSTNTGEITTSEGLEIVKVHIEESVVNNKVSTTFSRNNIENTLHYSTSRSTQTIALNDDSEKNLTQSVKENSKSNYTKTNTATSLLNLNSSPDGNPPCISDESRKENKSIKTKSTATSPINVNKKELCTFKSTMVQTEVTGKAMIVSDTKEPKISPLDNMHLLVPTAKLNPTTVENVLQVCLDKTDGRNSLSLETNSSKQTMKFIVQLPNLTQNTDGNQKIIKLDSSDSQDQKDSKTTSPKQIQIQHSSKEKTFSFSNKAKVGKKASDKEPYLDDLSPQNILSERDLKDIIEPTVSEVLKKINITQNNPSASSAIVAEMGKQVTNSSTNSELEKPSFILQTKHGLWKKIDNNPEYSFTDIDNSKQKTDSSNQTEAEKQNVYIQVAESLAEGVSEKEISVQKCNNEIGDSGKSYIEMLQPPPPSVGSVKSSVISSTYNFSSRSSSSTSTSSLQKDHRFDYLEKLSEGEVKPDLCHCNVGEVCGICVPRLDLSFGELKTKRRNRRRDNITKNNSDSDHSRNSKTRVISLSSIPLNLEPRPPPAQLITSGLDLINHKLENNSLSEPLSEENYAQLLFNAGDMIQIEGKKSTLRSFSDIANSVMRELNKELQIKKQTTDDKYVFSKPHSRQSNNVLSAASTSKLPEYACPSDSALSANSSNSMCSKKSLPSYKTHHSYRTPLVIKSPLETPKIDVVIEDSEVVSTSSYQTSVTSVSVDNLISDVSHSMSDLST